MEIGFAGEIWFWRGPAPFHFVTIPPDESADLSEIAALVSYGWGVIPVRAEIGETIWETSLFPKNGGYLLPVKASVREREGLDLGDVVEVTISVGSHR